MTEYKKIVEEQAQKIQEENNNNALIGFGWQRESEGSPHVVLFFSLQELQRSIRV
jgi:hypothetical protein